MILDSETGLITDVNPFLTDLLGYSREELIGRELWQISPFKDMVANKVAFFELQKKGYVRYEDLPLMTTDKRRVDVEFVSNVYEVSGKKVIQCNIRDISDRKLMQREKERLANELRLLLESTDEGIYGIDLEGKCSFINKAAAEMLGSTPEGLLGKNMHTAIHHSRPDGSPYPVVECPIFNAFKMGQKCLVDTEVLWRGDGSSFPAVYSSSPIIQDSAISGAVVTFRDITQRKKAEEELKKLTEDLMRSNQELQHFAYVASHDLQEPLRMISSYVQLLARRYKGKLDADADEFIAYAVDGAKRMQNMISGLLTYARVGTRGEELVQVDFNTALYATLENISISIEESGAVVTHDAMPSLLANETQVIHLFQNLISNAIKFRGSDPPRIHISAERSNKEWVFSVSDNGIGIDPQYHDRIFKIFQRLHGKEDYPGTGIGLAVCKRIVERLGGRMWVKSASGKGSTFYFALPIKKSGPK